MTKTLTLCAMLILAGCGTTAVRDDAFYIRRLEWIHSEIDHMTILDRDTTGIYLLRAERLEVYKHLTQ